MAKYDWRQATRVLDVFVDQQDTEKTAGIIFSPDNPDVCLVIYEEHPPFIHDLRKAGFHTALQQAMAGEQPDPVRLSDATVVDYFRARTPCVAAAFRPGTGEIALAFGEGDSFVHRFDTRTGKRLEPVAIENPTAVAYSNDGQFLLAGSSSGEIVTSRFTEDGVTTVRCAKLESKIVALGLEDKLETRVFGATDFHGLCEFHLHADAEEDVPVHMGADVETLGLVRNMKLKTIAVSELGIVGYGGVGNEVWLQSSYGGQGQVFALSELGQIRHLQFVDDREELVVVSQPDNTVKVLKVGLDDERRATVSRESQTFKTNENFPLIAAHKYGPMLCICQIVPAD